MLLLSHEKWMNNEWMNITILDMYNNHDHHTCIVTTLSMLKKLNSTTSHGKNQLKLCALTANRKPYKPISLTTRDGVILTPLITFYTYLALRYIIISLIYNILLIKTSIK